MLSNSKFKIQNSRLEIFLKFLLIATVFLLPLLFSQSTYNPCAVKLVFLRLMLTIGCVVWLLNSFIKSRFELVKTQLNLPVLIFISIGFLSFIICPFKAVAYKELLRVLSGGALIFLIMNSIKDQRSFNYIIGAITLSFILVVSFSLAQHLGINRVIAWGSKEFAATIGQKNIFAVYVILVFPILGSALILSKSKWLKSMLLIFLLISVYCLILAKSRSGYLGFMTAIIIYSVLYSKIKMVKLRNILLIIVILSVSIAVVAYLKYDKILEYLTFLKNENSIVMRKILWIGAINTIKRFPLFGTGIGTFTIFSPLYRNPAIDLCMPPEVFDSARCHNEFLQLSAEQGVLGFFAFMYVLYIVFRIGLTALKSKPDMYIIGLISGLCGLLIQSIFSISMRTVVPAAYFWIFCGLIIARVNIIGKTELKVLKFNIKISRLTLFSIIVLIMVVGSICIGANLRAFRGFLYFGKANRLEHVGYVKDAEEAYIKAASLNKSNPQIYYKLGALYAGEKKWDLAEKSYRRVIQIHPNYGLVNINLGFVLYKQGKIEEGIRTLEKGVKLHNKIPKYHRMLSEMRLVRSFPE